MEQKVYLKNNVVLEPLIDNWYAWSHLISPATYALNLKNRHLSILNSYISDPDIHLEAVQNPRMLGGPFMEFPKEKLNLAIEHRDKVENENKDLLQLAEDIGTLNALLKKHGDGMTLEPLYKEIPGSLKGCVELFYDINHNASYRLFEPLLYKSEFYKKASQSFKFYEITDDERTFVFSTPRINDVDFHLNIPFDDKRVDYLYETTRIAKPFSEIVNTLGIADSGISKFRAFFTENANPGYEKYTGDDIRLRYFGHACMLIETKNISILVDPVISYDYDSAVTRYTYKDLPDEIDYILITHNHQDHILLETVLKLKHKTKNIVVPKSSGYLQDPSLKHMLITLGFKNVIELNEFEEIPGTGIKITGIPFLGEHSDLNIRCKLCYLVEINNYRILFAADTNNISHEMYQRIGQMYGSIDILFLGLECDGAPLSWLYGPLLPAWPSREIDNSRRLSGSDFENAKSLIESLKPGHLYVYAMGQEPWLEYMMAIKYTDESNPIVNSKKIIEYCGKNGIYAEKLFGEKEIKLDPGKKESRRLANELTATDLNNDYTKITI